MTRDEITEEVRYSVAATLGLNEDELDMDMDKSLKDLGADSLDLVEISIDLEAETNVDFADEQRWGPTDTSITPNQIVGRIAEVMGR